MVVGRWGIWLKWRMLGIWAKAGDWNSFPETFFKFFHSAINKAYCNHTFYWSIHPSIITIHRSISLDVLVFWFQIIVPQFIRDLFLLVPDKVGMPGCRTAGIKDCLQLPTNNPFLPIRRATTGHWWWWWFGWCWWWWQGKFQVCVVLIDCFLCDGFGEGWQTGLKEPVSGLVAHESLFAFQHVQTSTAIIAIAIFCLNLHSKTNSI